MECVTCGGSDFIKDSGFFYCTECQTQSQEIREHVFQEENVNIKSAKKIRSTKAEVPENKLTSWECYNIIMCALTKELVNLGADTKLKYVSKFLWLRYLEKLEVFNLESDGKPKLPAVNIKRDVNLLYNQKRRKRNRRKSISDISSDGTSVTTKRERTKKKRALAQAQYDELSATHDSTLLTNETLTSLKGSSSEVSDYDKTLVFNRYSRKELRKRMSREHLQNHCADTTLELKCHTFTYKESSKKYQLGVTFLSPIKMYSILYLALLIVRDKVQLGDLLRFIREGHLTFNNYTKLLPETFSSKKLGLQNNNMSDCFTAKTLRIAAAKLASFLDVTEYIEVPNLNNICKRYCDELNLPNEIFFVVKNILSLTKPKLVMRKTDTIIPNYEGRCLSFILFTLKLLFALDGVTEHHLSRYAKLVNECNFKHKMFNIQEWLEYIAYRGLVISENNFSTSYSHEAEINSDQFLQYIHSNDISFDYKVKLTKEMNDYKQILSKLKEAQHDYITFLEFPAFLTPFSSYSKLISKAYGDKYYTQILDSSFQNFSIDFLLNSDNYLNELNKNIQIEGGGANDNLIWSKVETYRRRKQTSRENFNLVPLEIVDSKHNGCEDFGIEYHKTKRKRLYKLEQHSENAKNSWTVNNEIINSIINSMNAAKIQPNERYQVHYQPYRSYWMNFHMNVDTITASEFDVFFGRCPSTFRKLFKECSRMIEVESQDLFNEFQSTEIFLVYASYLQKRKKNRICVNRNLEYYIQLAEYNW